MGNRLRTNLVHIGLKATKQEKRTLQDEASRRGLSLSRFLVDTGLRASAGATGSPEPEAVYSAPRSGPSGFERQGWDFAVRSRYILANHYSPSEAIENHERLRELLAEGERIYLWNWFERFFPDLARKVPERRQVAFLKGMLLAWKQGLVLSAKMPAS